MMAKPIVATDLGRNLTYGLVEVLGRQIVHGEFADGIFPTEGELARRFGVSRSVSREAVKLLSAKGLVDGRPRSGTFVQSDDRWRLLDVDVLRWHVGRSLSLPRLRELAEMRHAIEPAIAELVALRGPPDVRATMLRSIDRLHEAARQRVDIIDAQVAFHLALIDASDNALLRQFSPILRVALPASLQQTQLATGQSLELDCYDAISSAIARRDPARARSVMQNLLEGTIAALDQLQRSRAA